MRKNIIMFFGLVLIFSNVSCGLTTFDENRDHLQSTYESNDMNLTKSSFVGTKSLSDDSSVLNADGPLYDNRAVRGKKIRISAYLPSASEGRSYTLEYGYSKDNLHMTWPMTKQSNNYFIGTITIGNDADNQIYYQVKDDIGNVYLMSNGEPYIIHVYNSILSYSFSSNYNQNSDIAGFLNIRYSGPAVADDAYIHYGWNNWEQINDSSVTIYNQTQYSFSEYLYASIEIPTWAEYFNMTVYGNGQWDNNCGLDYSECVKPLVYSYSYIAYSGNQYVNVYYANGNLGSPLYAHYGVDGWQSVQEKILNYYGSSNQGYFYNTLELDASVDFLDICFRQNNSWENNNGQNWKFDL